MTNYNKIFYGIIYIITIIFIIGCGGSGEDSSSNSDKTKNNNSEIKETMNKTVDSNGATITFTDNVTSLYIQPNTFEHDVDLELTRTLDNNYFSFSPEDLTTNKNAILNIPFSNYEPNNNVLYAYSYNEQFDINKLSTIFVGNSDLKYFKININKLSKIKIFNQDIIEIIFYLPLEHLNIGDVVFGLSNNHRIYEWNPGHIGLVIDNEDNNNYSIMSSDTEGGKKIENFENFFKENDMIYMGARRPKFTLSQEQQTEISEFSKKFSDNSITNSTNLINTIYKSTINKTIINENSEEQLFPLEMFNTTEPVCEINLLIGDDFEMTVKPVFIDTSFLKEYVTTDLYKEDGSINYQFLNSKYNNKTIGYTKENLNMFIDSQSEEGDGSEVRLKAILPNFEHLSDEQSQPAFDLQSFKFIWRNVPTEAIGENQIKFICSIPMIGGYKESTLLIKVSEPKDIKNLIKSINSISNYIPIKDVYSKKEEDIIYSLVSLKNKINFLLLSKNLEFDDLLNIMQENPSFNIIDLRKLISLYGTLIKLNASQKVLNPKFQSDVSFNFQIRNYDIIDNISILLIKNGNTIKTIYSGPIDKEQNIIRWNGRESDGEIVKGKFNVVLKVKTKNFEKTITQCELLIDESYLIDENFINKIIGIKKGKTVDDSEIYQYIGSTSESLNISATSGNIIKRCFDIEFSQKVEFIFDEHILNESPDLMIPAYSYKVYQDDTKKTIIEDRSPAIFSIPHMYGNYCIEIDNSIIDNSIFYARTNITTQLNYQKPELHKNKLNENNFESQKVSDNHPLFDESYISCNKNSCFYCESSLNEKIKILNISKLENKISYIDIEGVNSADVQIIAYDNNLSLFYLNKGISSSIVELINVNIDDYQWKMADLSIYDETTLLIWEKIDSLYKIKNNNFIIKKMNSYSNNEKELINKLFNLDKSELQRINFSYKEILDLQTHGWLTGIVWEEIICGNKFDINDILNSINIINFEHNYIPQQDIYSPIEKELITSIFYCREKINFDLLKDKYSFSFLIDQIKNKNRNCNETVLFYGATTIKIKNPPLLFNPHYSSYMDFSFCIQNFNNIDRLLIQVIDNKGKIIKKLYDGKILKQDNNLFWNGIDYGNHYLNGRYFLVATAFKKRLKKRIERDFEITLNGKTIERDGNIAMSAFSGVFKGTVNNVAVSKNVWQSLKQKGILNDNGIVIDDYNSNSPLEINFVSIDQENQIKHILSETKDIYNDLQVFQRSEIFNGKIIGIKKNDNDYFIYYIYKTNKNTIKAKAQIKGNYCKKKTKVVSQHFSIFYPQNINIDLGHEESSGYKKVDYTYSLYNSDNNSIIFENDHAMDMFDLYLEPGRYYLQAKNESWPVCILGLYSTKLNTRNWLNAEFGEPILYSSSIYSNNQNVTQVPFNRELEDKVQELSKPNIDTGSYSEPIDNYYYWCETTINEGVKLFRQISDNTKNIEYILLDVKVKSGDIHLINKEDDQLLLCWLEQDKDDGEDIVKVKYFEINISEISSSKDWLPDDLNSVMYDLSDIITIQPDNLLELDYEILRVLKTLIISSVDGNSTPYTLIRECYNRLISSEEDNQEIVIKQCFIESYMKTNPDRFWFNNEPLNFEIVETNIPQFLSHFGIENLFSIIIDNKIVGIGESPYAEPKGDINSFNGQYGLNITEKDHEIKYLNNTIFTIGREYCSNAANFRPSAINLNREREILANYYMSSDPEQIKPLTLKNNSFGFGNGWATNFEGIALLNYAQLENYEESNNNAISATLNFIIFGKNISFDFTSKDLNELINFQCLQKYSGYKIKIEFNNSASPFDWAIHLVNSKGTIYKFSTLVLKYSNNMKQKLDESKLDFEGMKTISNYTIFKIAYKLTEIQYQNTINIKYLYNKVDYSILKVNESSKNNLDTAIVVAANVFGDPVSILSELFITATLSAILNLHEVKIDIKRNFQYNLRRISTIKISKNELELNKINLYYRSNDPLDYKSFQINKIDYKTKGGDLESIEYKYNNIDFLESVSKNASILSSYQYSTFGDIQKTYLLTEISKQNQKKMKYNYKYCDLQDSKICNDLNGCNKLSQQEKQFFSNYILTSYIEDEKSSFYNYGNFHENLAVYYPYNENNKRPSIYFKEIKTIFHDETEVIKKYDNNMLIEKQIPQLSYSEIIENDYENRFILKKLTNDNLKQTITEFSDYNDFGYATRIEVFDPDSKRNKTIQLKYIADENDELSNIFKEANMIDLINKKSTFINDKLIKTIEYDYYISGLIKEKKIINNYEDRTSLTLGDFLKNDPITQEYIYDDEGRIIFEKNNLIEVNYVYQYIDNDGRNDQIKITKTSSIYYYDPSESDERNKIGEYTKIIVKDLFSDTPIYEIDENQRRYDYTYNDRNMLVELKYPDETAENWMYDIENRTTLYINRDNVKMIKRYNVDGNIVLLDRERGLTDQFFEYDMNGNITKRIDFTGIITNSNCIEYFNETFIYDFFDRVLLKANSNDQSSTFKYIPKNQTIISVQDQKMKEIITKDSFGNIIDIEKRKLYDSNLEKLLHKVNISIDQYNMPAIINFAEDSLDITRVNEDTNIVLNQTMDGLQTIKISGVGFDQMRRGINNSIINDILFVKDGLNRIIKEKEKQQDNSWKVIETYCYDENIISKYGIISKYQIGELTSVKTENTMSKYIYNINKKIAEEQHNYTGKDFFIRYKWNNDNVYEINIANPNKTIYYDYDEHQRLNTIEFDLNGSTKTFTILYEADNKIDKIIYPNGIIVDYYYNQARNVNKIKIEKDLNQFRTITYSYENGRITCKTDIIHEPEVNEYINEEVYSYDDYYNIQKVVKQYSNNDKRKEIYKYSSSYFMEEYISGNVYSDEGWIDEKQNIITSYHSVENDNRLREIKIKSQSMNYSQTIKYQESLLPYKITDSLNQVNDIRYDCFKNLIRYGDTRYVIDHKDRRVKEESISNGDEKYYLYDQYDRLISEISNEDKYTIFIWGIGNILLAKINSSDNIVYLHPNYMNNTITQSNDEGEIIAHNQYDVWGEPYNIYKSTPDISPCFIFSGKIYNKNSKSYNLGKRNYYPSFKRFIEDDVILPTLSNFKSFNPFVYSNNDPINYLDIDGKQPIESTCPNLNVTIDPVFIKEDLNIKIDFSRLDYILSGKNTTKNYWVFSENKSKYHQYLVPAPRERILKYGPQQIAIQTIWKPKPVKYSSYTDYYYDLQSHSLIDLSTDFSKYTMSAAEGHPSELTFLKIMFKICWHCSELERIRPYVEAERSYYEMYPTRNPYTN